MSNEKIEKIETGVVLTRSFNMTGMLIGLNVRVDGARFRKKIRLFKPLQIPLTPGKHTLRVDHGPKKRSQLCEFSVKKGEVKEFVCGMIWGGVTSPEDMLDKKDGDLVFLEPLA